MEIKWKILLTILLMFYIFRLCDTSYGRILIDLKHTYKEVTMAFLTWTASFRTVNEFWPTYIVLCLTRLYGYRISMIIGIFGSCLGLLLMASTLVSNQLPIAYGVFYGFGSSILLNTAMFLVGDLFPHEDKHHILATSLLMCLFPLAIATDNVIHVIIKATTWRWTYIILMAGIFLVGSLAVYLCRAYEATGSTTQDQPLFLFSHLKKKTTGLKVKIVASALIALWAVVSMMINFTILTTYVFVNYALNIGLKTSDGETFMVAFGLSELVTRLLTAVLGDKLFKDRLLILYSFCCLTACGISIYGYFADSFDLVIVYCVCLGIMCGPLNAGYYAICSEILNNKYLNELFSIGHFFYAVGQITSLSIVGYMFDRTNSYKTYFIQTGIMQLIAGLACCGILIGNYIFKIEIRNIH